MLCFLVATAFGQQEGGFDAHGFRLPSADPDARDPLTFLRPGDLSTSESSIGFVGEYASQPLAFAPGEDQLDVYLEDLVAITSPRGSSLGIGFAWASSCRCFSRV